MSKPSGTNRPKTSIRTDFKPLCFSLGTIRAAARYDIIQVVTATGIHLFPFRTEKLSPFTPMILLYQVGKWVAANFKSLRANALRLFCWRLCRPFFYHPYNPLKGIYGTPCWALRALLRRQGITGVRQFLVSLWPPMGFYVICLEGVPDGGAWCALWPESQAIWRFSHGLRKAGYPELSSP